MSASELHPFVDILERAEPVLVGAHRVEQIGHEQPVHDEAGTIGRRDRLLAERLGEPEHRPIRLVARRQRPDHLDELHDRHGIEEMQPREPIRPRRRRGKFGDAERRGVGHQNRVSADDGLERRVGLLLVLEVLHDRLDDEVARFQRLEGRRPRQVAERAVADVRSDLPFRHAVLDELADARKAFLEKRVVDFADDRPVSRCRAHLRDPRSHQTAAEHTDGFDLHHVLERA